MTSSVLHLVLFLQDTITLLKLATGCWQWGFLHRCLDVRDQPAPQGWENWGDHTKGSLGISWNQELRKFLLPGSHWSIKLDLSGETPGQLNSAGLSVLSSAGDTRVWR